MGGRACVCTRARPCICCCCPVPRFLLPTATTSHHACARAAPGHQAMCASAVAPQSSRPARWRLLTPTYAHTTGLLPTNPSPNPAAGASHAGGAGHALLFNNHVLVKQDFKVAGRRGCRGCCGRERKAAAVPLPACLAWLAGAPARLLSTQRAPRAPLHAISRRPPPILTHTMHAGLPVDRADVRGVDQHHRLLPRRCVRGQHAAQGAPCSGRGSGPPGGQCGSGTA